MTAGRLQREPTEEEEPLRQRDGRTQLPEDTEASSLRSHPNQEVASVTCDPLILAGVTKPPGNCDECSNPCSQFTWEFTATAVTVAPRSQLQVSCPPPPPFNPLWYFKASRGFALIPSGRLGNLRTPQCETPELNGAGQTLDLFGGFPGVPS